MDKNELGFPTILFFFSISWELQKQHEPHIKLQKSNTVVNVIKFTHVMQG